MPGCPRVPLLHPSHFADWHCWSPKFDRQHQVEHVFREEEQLRRHLRQAQTNQAPSDWENDARASLIQIRRVRQSVERLALVELLALEVQWALVGLWVLEAISPLEK